MADGVSIANNDSSAQHPSSTNAASPRDSNGWDGKLRVGRRAQVINAEILSDPDYSDEEAPPVEEISVDDGMLRETPIFTHLANKKISDLLDDYEPDTDVNHILRGQPRKCY